MELSQLFTRGSKLSDVPVDFRGMSYQEWQQKMLEAQRPAFEAYWKEFGVPLKDKRLWTPRDDYGMKGI